MSKILRVLLFPLACIVWLGGWILYFNGDKSKKKQKVAKPHPQRN